ncbi:MAG: NADH-quinone oxidoreductase subunit C [Candidatus Margulisiibacteriota bacterium]
MTEQEIISSLENKFNFLKEKIKLQRARRLWVEVEMANFPEVLKYLRQSQNFYQLLTITGLDEREAFAVIYHLSDGTGLVLNLKTKISRETPVLKSVMDIYPPAEIYERELVDLLGIKVEGLPPGNSYPLPDGWPAGQYPLRKDWVGVSCLDEEKKNV